MHPSHGKLFYDKYVKEMELFKIIDNIESPVLDFGRVAPLKNPGWYPDVDKL